MGQPKKWKQKHQTKLNFQNYQLSLITKQWHMGKKGKQ